MAKVDISPHAALWAGRIHNPTGQVRNGAAGLNLKFTGLTQNLGQL
jgi:hypothetical protein